MFVSAFRTISGRCSGVARGAGFLGRLMFIMKLLWMALFAGIYGAALDGVSLLLRLTSLTADVSEEKKDPSLIELQLEMDLLEFLSVRDCDIRRMLCRVSEPTLVT